MLGIQNIKLTCLAVKEKVLEVSILAQLQDKHPAARGRGTQNKPHDVFVVELGHDGCLCKELISCHGVLYVLEGLDGDRHCNSCRLTFDEAVGCKKEPSKHIAKLPAANFDHGIQTERIDGLEKDSVLRAKCSFSGSKIVGRGKG